MVTRTLYVELAALKPGMVLPQGLTVEEHQVVTLQLPPGHELTAENLEQLAKRRTLGAIVEQEDTRDEQERQLNAQRQAARLQVIFRRANMASPGCKALLQALFNHRSA